MVATLLGAAVHVIVGGSARRLFALLLAGWLGFGLGQFVGVAFQINFMNVGMLRVASAVLGAFAALVPTVFLTSRSRPRRIN